jgi:hypothetical protein
VNERVQLRRVDLLDFGRDDEASHAWDRY